MIPRENQFPGYCKDCGHHLKPGEGMLLGKNPKSLKWEMIHQHDCTSPKKEDNTEEPVDDEKWHTPQYKGHIDKDYHGE